MPDVHGFQKYLDLLDSIAQRCAAELMVINLAKHVTPDQFAQAFADTQRDFTNLIFK